MNRGRDFCTPWCGGQAAAAGTSYEGGRGREEGRQAGVKGGSGDGRRRASLANMAGNIAISSCGSVAEEHFSMGCRRSLLTSYVFLSLNSMARRQAKLSSCGNHRRDGYDRREKPVR